MIFSNSGDPKRYATGRYFPVNKDYPYLVFEIFDVRFSRGYRGFLLRPLFKDAVGIGMVTHIQRGIFAYPVLATAPPKSISILPAH